MIQPSSSSISRFVKITLSTLITLIITGTLIIYAQNVTSVIPQTIGDANGWSIDRGWYQDVNDKLTSIFSNGGNVGIKKTPTNPAYALTISGNTDVRGSVRYAHDTRACNTSTRGSIRYNNTNKQFEGCDGVCWGNGCNNVNSCPSGYSWNGSGCVLAGNGACGSASGVATVSYPTANWCTAGSKVDVDAIASDGTYNWNCNGSGGSVSCSAINPYPERRIWIQVTSRPIGPIIGANQFNALILTPCSTVGERFSTNISRTTPTIECQEGHFWFNTSYDANAIHGGVVNEGDRCYSPGEIRYFSISRTVQYRICK